MVSHFDATYRRFKYLWFVNNLANPNCVFTGEFQCCTQSCHWLARLQHHDQMGDFDLTLLPKNEKIRFNVGYSPERYSGPAGTDEHVGGNDFSFQSQLRSRANDFRFGADGKVGPIDFSFLQGFRRFRDDSVIHLGPTPGINLNPTAASLRTYTRDEPTRGNINYTRFSAHTLVAKKLDITGRIVYSKATSDFTSQKTSRHKLEPQNHRMASVLSPLHPTFSTWVKRRHRDRRPSKHARRC